MSGRVLVAGIGNVFLGDDGFGVEVAGRLTSIDWPCDVRVLDIGTRARYLAYEILDGGYDTAILVDAVSRGGPPGTVYVIEPERVAPPPMEAAASGGHGMNVDAMLDFLRVSGAPATRILVVGCEPATVDERIGLSGPVAAAVDEAVGVVRRLVCV